VDGRPLHTVGEATVYGGNRVVVLLHDSTASREAAVLLKEDLVTPWYWGSASLRLRG
jgi:hypothetical protein